VDLLIGGKPLEQLAADKLDLKSLGNPARDAIIHPGLANRCAHHKAGSKIHSPPITGVVFTHRAAQITGVCNVIRHSSRD
jgi:hypothetical protein